MAEGKKVVLLYCDIIHTIEKMDNETAGLFFKHYLRYVNDLNPETDNLLVDIAFESVKQNLKRDLKKWDKKMEQCSEAGKRSAELRKLKKDEIQRKATSVESVKKIPTNPTVKDTVTVKDKDIYNNFIAEVKNGGFATRIESMYMRLKLKQGSLNPLLNQFKLHIIEENRDHKNTNDYFINFKNWLNIQDRLKLLDKYR